MRLSKVSTYLINAIILLLLCSGLIQCVIALGQLGGVIDKINNSHWFSGTFYNPGPFGCYLAVVAPLLIKVCISKSKIGERIGSVILPLFVALIIASGSRTAIIAVTLGCIVTLWNNLLIPKFFRKYKCFSIIMLLIVSAGAYLIKKDSADGRLFLWKIASIAVCNIPLTGSGWNEVPGVYGETQESYFESGRGTEQEIKVADAPDYVFNEYLQIAIAYGPLTLISVIIVLVGSFVIAIKNHARDFAGGIVAVSVVMFASYPLQFPLFVVTITLIAVGCWLQNPHILLSKIIIIGIVISSTLFLSNSQRRSIEMDFEKARMLHIDGNYKASISHLKQLLPYTSDPMPLNLIGKNYRALEIPDSAEYYFLRSTYRCPNRLYPHYLLMQLYSDSIFFNPSLRRREAEIIISHPIKIHSPAINEMKRIAKKVSEAQ